MQKFCELSVGSRFKRITDTPHTFHTKEGDGTCCKSTFTNVYGGVYVCSDTVENIKPDEAVAMVTKHNTWKGRRNQPPTKEDVVNLLSASDWTEHHTLIRRLQQYFSVSDIDYQVVLAQLVADARILRERAPSERKMSFRYKTK